MTRHLPRVSTTAPQSPVRSQASRVETPLMRTVSRLLRGGPDRGAATAEFAIVLPTVVVIIALILVVARTTMVVMACQDAAAVIVRELVVSDSRAHDGELANTLTQRLIGDDANVDLTYQADSIIVQTQCPVVPDPLGVLPQQVEGRAVGIVERGA